MHEPPPPDPEVDREWGYPRVSRAERLWIFQHHDYCIHIIAIIDYITIMPFEGDLHTPFKVTRPWWTEATVDRTNGTQKPWIEAMVTQCLCIHSPDYCIHSPAKYIHENP